MPTLLSFVDISDLKFPEEPLGYRNSVCYGGGSVSGFFDGEDDSDIEYENGEPGYKGTRVVRCFKDRGNGLLFRIVNDDEFRWAFYNDVPDYNMFVTCTFGPRSHVIPLGKTMMRKNELTGDITLEVMVGPRSTEMFLDGVPKGFKASFEARPIPRKECLAKHIVIPEATVSSIHPQGVSDEDVSNRGSRTRASVSKNEASTRESVSRNGASNRGSVSRNGTAAAVASNRASVSKGEAASPPAKSNRSSVSRNEAKQATPAKPAARAPKAAAPAVGPAKEEKGELMATQPPPPPQEAATETAVSQEAAAPPPAKAAAPAPPAPAPAPAPASAPASAPAAAPQPAAPQPPQQKDEEEERDEDEDDDDDDDSSDVSSFKGSDTFVEDEINVLLDSKKVEGEKVAIAAAS